MDQSITLRPAPPQKARVYPVRSDLGNRLEWWVRDPETGRNATALEPAVCIAWVYHERWKALRKRG